MGRATRDLAHSKHFLFVGMVSHRAARPSAIPLQQPLGWAFPVPTCCGCPGARAALPCDSEEWGGQLDPLAM